MRIIASLFWLLVIFSCSAQKPIAQVRFSPTQVVYLLDREQAARAITYDKTDRFFERVTACEMSIQMKQELDPAQDRREMVDAYIEFLHNDVDDYTAEEAEFVADVMKEVFETCQSIDEDIFPEKLLLIKTKGMHYGNSVYYTRENCIVIPANELEERNREKFLSTMYHELSHVYSRLNPEKRREMYRLIGFETIGLRRLEIPESLSERIFYNPDGVDFGQKITLKTKDGQTIHAIPVIYSNRPGYTEEIDEFFGYVEFNLFQIEKTDSGTWRVLTQDDGYSSTLNLRDLPDFFRQIKDNTQYIIHPDEVLADNFSFLMLSQKDKKFTAKFSKEGKQLIQDLEKILKG